MTIMTTSGLTGTLTIVPLLPRIFPGPEALGLAAAQVIGDRLEAHPTGEPFLLGCPGGRSLRTTYRAFADIAARRRLDLSRLRIVMMDEYVRIRDGSAAVVDPRAPFSCRRFATVEIRDQINAALRSAGAGDDQMIPADNVWLPDASDPEAYEERLDAAGMINIFLLASGSSDGHIAFNPPGTDRDARTRVVALPESTRRDNLSTFPSFGGDLAAVPDHGVTVGVATIRDRSVETIMVLHGRDKRQAAKRVLTADRYQPDWPATIVSECRSPQIFVDQAAMPVPSGANLTNP